MKPRNPRSSQSIDGTDRRVQQASRNSISKGGQTKHDDVIKENVNRTGDAILREHMAKYGFANYRISPKGA